MPFSLYTDFQESDIQVLKVRIEGELTIYEAAEFKEKIDLILKNSAVTLEIDLFKIQKIDTSCLQILLSFKKVALAKYPQVRFVNFNNNILSLIDLYGLSDFFRDTIVEFPVQKG